MRLDRAKQKCPCQAIALEGLNEQLIVLNRQASRPLFQYRGTQVRCSQSFAAPGMGQTNRRATWTVVRVALFNFGFAALVVFIPTPVRLMTFRTPASLF